MWPVTGGMEDRAGAQIRSGQGGRRGPAPRSTGVVMKQRAVQEEMEGMEGKAWRFQISEVRAVFRNTVFRNPPIVLIYRGTWRWYESQRGRSMEVFWSPNDRKINVLFMGYKPT